MSCCEWSPPQRYWFCIHSSFLSKLSDCWKSFSFNYSDYFSMHPQGSDPPPLPSLQGRVYVAKNAAINACDIFTRTQWGLQTLIGQTLQSAWTTVLPLADMVFSRQMAFQSWWPPRDVVEQAVRVFTWSGASARWPINWNRWTMTCSCSLQAWWVMHKTNIKTFEEEFTSTDASKTQQKNH